MFIYRPEYYFKEDDKNVDFESIKNKAELLIEKHRNGPLTTINLKFLGEYARFYEETDEDFSQAIRLLSESGFSGSGRSFTVQSKMNNENLEDDLTIRQGDI